MPDAKKWIRSIKENPFGKVVADPEGNRWQWGSDDDTQRLLKQLDNDALTIEKADIRPTRSRKQKAAPATPPQTEHVPLKPKRDSGGGFNPYDHAGKPRRR
jgi:hypothetical protein